MSNEIQRLYFGSQSSPVAPISGTFDLIFDGQTAPSLDYNGSAATMQTALESLSTVGSGNILVSSTANGYTLEFRSALANTNVALMTATSSLFQAASVPVLALTQTGAADSNSDTSISPSYTDGDEFTYAQLTLTFSPQPNSGTWSFGGNTYSYSDSAPTVTGWSTNGSAQSGTVTAQAQSFGSQPQPSYDRGSLVYSVPGSTTQYSVTPGDATAGAFEMSLNGSGASNIPYNATQAQFNTALDNASIAYTVTGSDGGPWTLTSDANQAPNGGDSLSTYSSDPLRKSCSIEIVTTQVGESSDRAHPHFILFSYEDAKRLGLI